MRTNGIFSLPDGETRRKVAPSPEKVTYLVGDPPVDVRTGVFQHLLESEGHFPSVLYSWLLLDTYVLGT